MKYAQSDRQLNGYNFEGREKLVRKKETKN